MHRMLLSCSSCYLKLLNKIDKIQKRICRTIVLHLLPLLQPWLSAKMLPAKVFSIGSLVDLHLNWLGWAFFILEGSLLIILIDCMIFLSQFLDVIRMSMPTVSFLAQLVSGTLYLYNAFL